MPHEFLVAFSCKLRGLCPSCHQKRELLWAQWAEQELLEDVPYRQVVFTIPKRLRLFFRYDRKLLGERAACAWRALKLSFEAYFDHCSELWRRAAASLLRCVVRNRSGAAEALAD